MALTLTYRPIAPEVLEAAKAKGPATSNVDLSSYLEALMFATQNGMAAEIGDLGEDSVKAHRRRFGQAVKQFEDGKYLINWMKTDDASILRFTLKPAPTPEEVSAKPKRTRKAKAADAPANLVEA